MIPIMIDPDLVPIAVAGAGNAARRRVSLALDGGAKEVRVFAPEGAEAYAGLEGIRLHERWPDAADLETIRVLYIADLPVQQAEDLAERARRKGILVNVEDVKPLCDFHVPSVVRRGSLLVTVATGGRSPGLARRLRKYLEGVFGPEWAGRVDELAHKRQQWLDEGCDLPELARRTEDHIDRNRWLR